MKSNWQTKRLGEIIKLEYGKPLPKSKRNPSGEYAVYGANGIKSRSDIYYFDRPSIIVGRKGSAGELNLVDGKFWPLDVTYFVTFNEKEYDLKYLYNLLSTLKLPKLAKGVKPGINRNDVYAIEVSVPELFEQRQIVKTLDAVFQKIEKVEINTRQKLADLEELRHAILRKELKQ